MQATPSIGRGNYKLMFGKNESLEAISFTRVDGEWGKGISHVPISVIDQYTTQFPTKTSLISDLKNRGYHVSYQSQLTIYPVNKEQNHKLYPILFEDSPVLSYFASSCEDTKIDNHMLEFCVILFSLATDICIYPQLVDFLIRKGYLNQVFYSNHLRRPLTDYRTTRETSSLKSVHNKIAAEIIIYSKLRKLIVGLREFQKEYPQINVSSSIDLKTPITKKLAYPVIKGDGQLKLSNFFCEQRECE